MVAILLAAGAAVGQTHAPWPADWNNWNDPALWVTVGNPGNVGEASGWGRDNGGPERICGSVAYAYNIGKYEVTAGQYTAFLNAVGGVDTYALYNAACDGDGPAQRPRLRRSLYRSTVRFRSVPLNRAHGGRSVGTY